MPKELTVDYPDFFLQEDSFPDRQVFNAMQPLIRQLEQFRNDVVEVINDLTVTSTTALLEDITDDINTLTKLTGKMVFNTTTSKPVWAVGTTAASVWVDATGATAHTPI